MTLNDIPPFEMFEPMLSICYMAPSLTQAGITGLVQKLEIP